MATEPISPSEARGLAIQLVTQTAHRRNLGGFHSDEDECKACTDAALVAEVAIPEPPLVPASQLQSARDALREIAALKKGRLADARDVAERELDPIPHKDIEAAVRETIIRTPGMELPEENDRSSS